MILRVTKCGRQKMRVGSYPPDVLYLSPRIRRFAQFCKENSLDWAILSAEHGLFFPDEKHSYYDTTFKTVDGQCRFIVDGQLLEERNSEEKFQALVEKIKTQADIHGVESVLMFEPPEEPQRAKCYLLVLHMALDRCGVPHKTFNQLLSHIESLGINGRVRLVTSLERLTLGEVRDGNPWTEEEWLRGFRDIIRAYHQERRPDPFLAWFRERVKSKELRTLFERVMTILVDARFDQRTTAESALENTKRVFRAGLIREGPVSLEDVPTLIPREGLSSNQWRYSFYIAHGRLVDLARDIIEQSSWSGDLLIKRVREVPYLGAKTSRLAVRWLYELIPEVNIDMRSYTVPVDDNLYRVAARLGVLDPYVDKYYPGTGGGPGDEKIQKLARRSFPDQPYLIDEPMWFEGRSKKHGGHCYPINPEHAGCLFEAICPKKYSGIDPSKIGIKEKSA